MDGSWQSLFKNEKTLDRDRVLCDVRAKNPEGDIKTLSNKGLARDKSRIEINREWCKGCGICVVFCPKEVLGLDKEEKAVVLHPENCDLCGMCELRCPDIAIEIIQDDLHSTDES